jgi:hypothetical protein
MLCYIYYCNYIKVVPMKSRSASESVKTFDIIRQELTVKGFEPKLQTLDNVISLTVKNYFTVKIIAYQLVPPQCHRRNAAERAIRTFKETNVLMGQTLATSGNHNKYPADISSASAALRRRALPLTRGLQQNSFCSARMPSYRTRETRKAANLGSSPAAWIYTWSCHASLPVSKCIHLDKGQRTHRGYSRILSP